MNMNTKWPPQPPRVTSVRVVDAHRLELAFNDGISGIVDLQGWVLGTGGVFEPLDNPAFFRQVRLSAGGGTIEWPNGVDLCPDVLYSKATGISIPFAEDAKTVHA